MLHSFCIIRVTMGGSVVVYGEMLYICRAITSYLYSLHNSLMRLLLKKKCVFV